MQMYLLIVKNPYMTPKDVMKELGIEKYSYYRYFNELSAVVPLSYQREQNCCIIGSLANNAAAVKKPEEFYTLSRGEYKKS